MPKTFFYGGQAVIQGVMIRGQRNASIAVRRPDGEIGLHTEPLSTLYTGTLRRIVLVRGIIVLIETLILGTKALMHSASEALGEEKEEVSPAFIWLAAAIGLAFAVGLFFILPLLAIRWADPYIHSSILSNLIEGAIRLALFVGYLKAVGLMPEIKRVFAYHGAEHKTIHAFESQETLEVQAIKKYSTAHPRCGTAFLLVVMVIAVLVFALLGRPSIWISILSRIFLIPVIASISYEIIRLSGTYSKVWAVRALISPALALQTMTTREPDDSQIEVAICALNGALRADGVIPPEIASSTYEENATGTDPSQTTGQEEGAGGTA
ncbi:MAG: DUF1385 domain-containing protein [Chloroflexi bacterium]|nr:DUF1385 domain-containing protein [Chloroflexota bacterium]